MAYKNIELRRQRGRERYYREREKRQEYARKHYEEHKENLREKNRVRARKNHPKYKERIQKYLEASKDRRRATGRAYYEEHKEEIAAYHQVYRTEHAEELRAKRSQAKTELDNAHKMCPAFMFLDKIRVTNTELYLTKYRPNSNLAHKAAKSCFAIQCGDWSQCPINVRSVVAPQKMACSCPMPHVFEFENAVAEIRKLAKEISKTHQK